MTKEMYQKCLNEKMEIFGKLPKDVQEAMQSCERLQLLNDSMVWGGVYLDPLWCLSSVYRIDPSTPYEQEFYEVGITTVGVNFPCLGIIVNPFGTCVLSNVTSSPNFLGIIYEKDGKETLRTSVDLAFGTPKRVRFAK